MRWLVASCTPRVKAAATVGAYSLTDSVHVTVSPPTFDVTAAPASIAGPQSVTFTATLTPAPPNGWSLSGYWTRRPDSGTGGISAGCPSYENPCTRTISKSGWMKATCTIGEYTLVDSAHVRIIPCPTNRNPLDDPAVRQALKNAYSQSVATNQEHVVAVFHNPSFGYYTQPVPTSYASQCKASFTPPNPNGFSGDDLVAIAHAHPHKPGTNQWCPEFGNYIADQGGSKDDWKSFNHLQQEPAYQAVGWNDLEYWIINGDYVHVMEPGKKKGSEKKPGATRFTWNTSTCQW